MRTAKKEHKGRLGTTQLPGWLKEKLKTFKTVSALTSATGLNRNTVERIFEDPDRPVAKRTLTRILLMFANHGKWSLENNVHFVMRNSSSRESFIRLVHATSESICLFAPSLNLYKHNVYLAAETHKSMFEAMDALLKAGKTLWKIHTLCPEYDPVLFEDTDFLERWQEMTGAKRKRSTKKFKPRVAWQPFTWYNEDPDLALTKAHESDAGFDICMKDEEVTIEPQHSRTVSTGFHIVMPKHHVGLILSRSGLATKYGIEVGAGVIDPGYRGEIKVLLHNHGTESVTFHKGDRIAQIVLMNIYTGRGYRAASLEDLGSGDRNDQGFGSSGI